MPDDSNNEKYRVINDERFLDIFIVKNNRRQFDLGCFLYELDAQKVCDEMNEKKG